MKIGNFEIKGHAALAPMAGVADTAMRTICSRFGAAYTVGEMASAKGLCMSDRKTAELLTVTDAERPMAVQLFGSEPDIMALAAKKAAQFAPDVIDINMGCPAPKVAGNGCGSALMRNPPLAGKIIAAVAAAVEIPVTVKIRKGWDNGCVNAVEIAKIAEAAGAAAVTVHGRTREQMYAPPADLDIIAAVKASVRIPVIGNGDIGSACDAKRMYDRTGCDLVMIGRGAMGNPWIFTEIESFFKTGNIPPRPSCEERMNLMLQHIKLLCDLKGESRGIREARKHAAWYMKGLDGAAGLRKKAGGLEHYDDAVSLAELVLNRNPGA